MAEEQQKFQNLIVLALDTELPEKQPTWVHDECLSFLKNTCGITNPKDLDAEYLGALNFFQHRFGLHADEWLPVEGKKMYRTHQNSPAGLQAFYFCKRALYTVLCAPKMSGIVGKVVKTGGFKITFTGDSKLYGTYGREHVGGYGLAAAGSTIACGYHVIVDSDGHSHFIQFQSEVPVKENFDEISATIYNVHNKSLGHGKADSIQSKKHEGVVVHISGRSTMTFPGRLHKCWTNFHDRNEDEIKGKTLMEKMK